MKVWLRAFAVGFLVVISGLVAAAEPWFAKPAPKAMINPSPNWGRPPAPPRPDGGFNPAPWIGGLGGVINALTPQNNNNNHRPQNSRWDNGDDEGYYPQQQYTDPQQQYTPPAPPRRVAPKNVIKDAVITNTPAAVIKNAPPLNLIHLNTLSLSSTAETNARQQVESEQAINSLDQATAQKVAASGDIVLMQDFNNVVLGGSTEADMDKFLKQHGPTGDNKLTVDAVDSIKIRQALAGYNRALNNGSLNAQQRQDALDQIQAAVDQYQINYPNQNDPTFMGGVITDHITHMGNLNTLGRLADISQDGGNPFPSLILGAGQAGMPVAFVSEMTGYPVMSVPPIASGSAAAIVLMNSKSNGQAVSYLLDDHNFEMNAGEEQKLDRSYQVSFDPGFGGSQKQYSLTSGVYEWRSDPTTGWGLFKVKVKVEIDNSRYDGDFRYLITNEPRSVSAGSMAVHESALPIEIAFDGGNGEETHKQLKSGRYLVGLDPARGQLDLFDSSKVDEAAVKEPQYQSSTLMSGSKATQAQRVEALHSQQSSQRQKIVSPLGGGSGSSKSVEELLNLIKKKAVAPITSVPKT